MRGTLIPVRCKRLLDCGNPTQLANTICGVVGNAIQSCEPNMQTQQTIRRLPKEAGHKIRLAS
jgi:hypothetical protein